MAQLQILIWQLNNQLGKEVVPLVVGLVTELLAYWYIIAYLYFCSLYFHTFDGVSTLLYSTMVSGSLFGGM